MADWQTIAAGFTVLAAAGWLLWVVVPRKQTSASGCGSGCSACPVASTTTTETPRDFVGLDVLQASIPTDVKPRGPIPTTRS